MGPLPITGPIAMTTTSRLNLPYLQSNQAQKHVTLNESLRRLDTLVQTRVLSSTLMAPPAEPNDGDAYIVPAGATGTWETYLPHALAVFVDGGWQTFDAIAGLTVFDVSEDSLRVYTGSAWVDVVSPSSTTPDTAPLFGVNTQADTVNRLAVKADSELLSHDDVTPGSGDARKIINRADTANTASVVFQTDYAGSAEFGLLGNDAFGLKTSADGAAWSDAVTIDVSSGFTGIAETAPQSPLHVSGPTLISHPAPLSPVWSRHSADLLQLRGGNSTSAGAAMHILGGVSGYGEVVFGTPDAGFRGRIRYDFEEDELLFYRAGAVVGKISTSFESTNAATPVFKITKTGGTGGTGRISFSQVPDQKAAQFRINWDAQSFGAFEWWAPTNGANGQSLAAELGHDEIRFMRDVTVDQGLVVGQPAGGSLGAGTVHAEAVYDDNALLSCYVLEQAVLGEVGEATWDARAPSGHHAPLRQFMARIGTPHDPLTLDGYAAHWRTKGHLTSMPNEAKLSEPTLPTGAWIQRLIETVEIHAVLIERLNQALKARD